MATKQKVVVVETGADLKALTGTDEARHAGVLAAVQEYLDDGYLLSKHAEDIVFVPGKTRALVILTKH